MDRENNVARRCSVLEQSWECRSEEKCMVTGNAHIQVCCLVCSPLYIVFVMLEVEVHQKKRNRACSIVAAY